MDNQSTFRWLLALGAVTSLALGVWGLVWTSMLESVLGLDVTEPSLGLSRLYGAVMISVGVGYALAAARPQHNRGLLVPLFFVPLLGAVAAIAGVSRQEIETGQGIGFAVYNLAYCLFYFRLYPRVSEPSEPDEVAEEPPASST